MTSHMKCNIAIFMIGFALVIIGVSLGIYCPIFFKNLYDKELQLTPSSTAFELWRRTPVPLYLDVYLFNWTNSEEFQRNKSVIPNFEEIGPFVFKEVHERVNISWNENKTVTYNQTRQWIFIPEESKNLSLEITNLNVIATTLSQLLKNYHRQKRVLNFILDKFEKIFTTTAAQNWLFEGIDDKLLDFLTSIENIFKIPPTLKKFGWFYNRNMSSSYDGIFTINTGLNNIFDVGTMVEWNRVNKTNYYSAECAMVNGTSGELFPPMKSALDNITFFISDICSSITLNHAGSSIIEGINSHIYVGGKTTFDNGQFFPENKCFCRGECAPYGARDVTACRVAPLFFSFPHFYQANESYRKNITGMVPNKSEHEFMIQLDPVTGIPTNVKAQLQINLRLEPVEWLSMFSNVPKLYIPMMWFRQRANITPELAQKALIMEGLRLGGLIICYALVGVGCLIIIVRMCVIYLKMSNKSDMELLIPPETVYDDEETEAEEK